MTFDERFPITTHVLLEEAEHNLKMGLDLFKIDNIEDSLIYLQHAQDTMHELRTLQKEIQNAP